MSEFDSYRREIGAFFGMSLAIQKAKIRCAKCKKTVDRWEVQQNVENDTLTFRVFCHGAVDTVTLTGQQLMDATGVTLCDAFKCVAWIQAPDCRHYCQKERRHEGPHVDEYGVEWTDPPGIRENLQKALRSKGEEDGTHHQLTDSGRALASNAQQAQPGDCRVERLEHQAEERADDSEGQGQGIDGPAAGS